MSRRAKAPSFAAGWAALGRGWVVADLVKARRLRPAGSGRLTHLQQ